MIVVRTIGRVCAEKVWRNCEECDRRWRARAPAAKPSAPPWAAWTCAQRAKEWITSPDPEDARKRAWRDRLIRLARRHPAWLLGCEDEVWWSRLARPALQAWQDAAHPLR